MRLVAVISTVFALNIQNAMAKDIGFKNEQKVVQVTILGSGGATAFEYGLCDWSLENCKKVSKCHYRETELRRHMNVISDEKVRKDIEDGLATSIYSTVDLYSFYAEFGKLLSHANGACKVAELSSLLK